MKRRKFIKGLCTASAVAVVATPSTMMAKDAPKVVKKGPNAITYDAALKVITGGKGAKDSILIKLTVPEIAENGAVVPVKVNVDNPMTPQNHVKAIHVLAKKNGNARCADVNLTPLNAKGYFATRIKLSKTQEVVAVVELSDGSFISSSRSVKVTIGGCG
jgi:sulfur-oxidizing protein SoxY